MPRARQANRTDLNQPPIEPVTAVPNQPYGEAGAQRAAQSAVPIGTPATPVPAPLTAAPARGAGASVGAAPGSLPFLHPTNRPNEPITAGLPFGEGPGPEVLNNDVVPVHPVATAFRQIANQSPAVSPLAEAAQLLGL